MTDIITFRAYVAAIAAAMGEDWQLVNDGSDFTQRCPHIRKGDNGPEFYLSNTWAGKGRVSVLANYPKDAQGREQRPYFSQYSEHGTASPSITFAETKNPALAAKDISRRFLPAFLPLWEKMAAQVAASNDYNARQLDLAKATAEILGGEVKQTAEGTSSVRLGYRDRGVAEVKHLDVEENTVRIEVRGVTLAQLARIRQLLEK